MPAEVVDIDVDARLVRAERPGGEPLDLHYDELIVAAGAREPTGVIRYEAGTVLWTAGVKAPPLVAALAARTGAQRDRSGRILVDPDLTIPGYPEISVVGDLMCLQNLPGMAEVAMQSGRYAARRIRHRVAGDTVIRPFRYRDFGSAAYISRLPEHPHDVRISRGQMCFLPENTHCEYSKIPRTGHH